eukprot:TRINITY_DN2830_c0_g3_i1.p1 TRINITY_DN2830_c0_g3~~TRINITY_DN2830_c0_g3_i1.p1  ORF type:complete len:116 (-),score=51.34 TRINITY_DN2830_c0_g3_i1:109-456(-)
MGYDKKTAAQAVEATNTTQVDECVMWITEKHERERVAKEEKKRAARLAREAAQAEEAAELEAAQGGDMVDDDEDEEDEFSAWSGEDSGSDGWGTDDGEDPVADEPKLLRLSLIHI